MSEEWASLRHSASLWLSSRPKTTGLHWILMTDCQLKKDPFSTDRGIKGRVRSSLRSDASFCAMIHWKKVCVLGAAEMFSQTAARLALRP